MTVSTTPEQAVTATPGTTESTAKPAAPKTVTKAVGRKSPLIPKALAKAAVKAPTKVMAKSAAKPVAEKPAKLKKPKLVRDSFTIPKAEYTVLDDLKQRAGKLGSPVKKSELIRAGVKALAAMSDTVFLSAVMAVPTIKTGRPAKAKPE